MSVAVEYVGLCGDWDVNSSLLVPLKWHITFCFCWNVLYCNAVIVLLLVGKKIERRFSCFPLEAHSIHILLHLPIDFVLVFHIFPGTCNRFTQGVFTLIAPQPHKSIHIFRAFLSQFMGLFYWRELNMVCPWQGDYQYWGRKKKQQTVKLYHVELPAGKFCSRAPSLGDTGHFCHCTKVQRKHTKKNLAMPVNWMTWSCKAAWESMAWMERKMWLIGNLYKPLGVQCWNRSMFQIIVGHVPPLPSRKEDGFITRACDHAVKNIVLT